MRIARHAVLSALLLLAGFVPAWAAPAPRGLEGGNNGAAYRIQVPGNWNGTLVLYSHGYVPPAVENPPKDAPDAATEAYLLDHGYALAGSAYSATGWAVSEAVQDQVALLDLFEASVGK